MKNPGRTSSRRPAAGAEKMKLLSALMATVFAVSAHAAATEAWVATSTRAHDPRAAVHVAPLRAGEQVDVVVSLKLRNKSELDILAARLMSRRAGVRPLSPAQFMDKYAPTADDAAAVVAYLRGQGFTDIEVAPNNLLVSATGSAGAIRSAFKADLHEYDVDGRRAYANVTDAMVPEHLAGVVNGVVGLQNVHLMHTHARRMAQPDASSTQASGAIQLRNFPAIYGADSLPSATTGLIGIITAGKVTQTISDLKSFAASNGYPVPYVTTAAVGSAGSSTSGIDEWNMDSQAALAAAGGSIAQMILYDVTDLSDASLTKGYNRAVTDRQAIAINVSLGGCEKDAVSIEPTQDAIFESATVQGQMFSVSSGDSGANECGGSTEAQSYPAASPYVIAVGGTTLTTTGGNTWAGETAWAGSGGGPSLTEKAGYDQTASGVLGASTMRGVPDIAFDAAPSTGALVLINGSLVQIGGTSLAAPLWTGFWTRIQSAHGNAESFPSFDLYYNGAKNPSWFHDVTSGNQGYAAAPGWDYASGWGSVQVANFSTGLGPTTLPPGPPHPSPPPQNLVLNGGFEGSAAPWTVSSGTWCTKSTCAGEKPNSGTGFLWLGGHGTVHTESASQTFRVESIWATRAGASFYLHVDTADKSKTAVHDTLTVSVTSLGTTTTLATYSNLDAAKGYVYESLDLTPWLGLPVTLTFTAKEDGSAQTSFVIDDVDGYAD